MTPELEREIEIAKAEVHAVQTREQEENFIEQRMMLAFTLGQSSTGSPHDESTRRRVTCPHDEQQCDFPNCLQYGPYFDDRCVALNESRSPDGDGHLGTKSEASGLELPVQAGRLKAADGSEPSDSHQSQKASTGSPPAKICEFCQKPDGVPCAMLDVCPDCWRDANQGSGWMERALKAEAALKASTGSAPGWQPTTKGETVMEQKPSVGRIVLFRQHASNGTVEHPAIINRVWTDVCVNLTVFPDCGEPVVKTSVLFDDNSDLSKNEYAWRWPPRV